MSDAVLQRAQGRGGELACVCDPVAVDEDPAQPSPQTTRSIAALATANAFSVLAQALSISVLPAAGLILAPNSAMAALPFMALLIGAGLATLPAAYLTTGWDRRFGFALGATMG
ncbi:MAG: hypothetical protein JWO88_3951, partial [Frankiales bacterium]|nr:hypothetical protein [Frankiales bacterium]